MADATPEAPTVDWPTDEGIWMGYHDGLGGWFPFETMALKDDLPSKEQMRLEKECPEQAPPRATLTIVARWPQSETNWPYTFKGCHPVKKWRQPTDVELSRAKKFYSK